MKLTRQTILMDVDDTFLESSQEIIRQLNIKNNTNKTIYDLTDYCYQSIDPSLTHKDVIGMYDSDEFFLNVNINNGALKFVNTFEKIFDIVFVSYGTSVNLHKKANLINECAMFLNWNNVYFAACESGKCSKSDIHVEYPYLAIDNHIKHLEELNAPRKILLKNNIDVYWNQPNINDTTTYLVNCFDEIYQMVQFDVELKKHGIYIDA